jgi:hypothetical protein
MGAATKILFFTDGAFTPHRLPLDRRGELELRIKQLRTQLWSLPEDRSELLGMIEAAEAELRELGRGGR